MAAAITVRTDRGEERLELEEFEARVARGEIAPQCPTRFEPVTGHRFVAASTLEIFRLKYSPRELHFSSNFRFGGVPTVTVLFTALNVVWYVAMQLRPIGTPDDTLVAYGAKAGPLLLDLGQFWRLLTANFVHRDLLHIGMNLFVLFNFAGALENAFRKLDMVLILLFSALGTTVLSALVTNPISAGASGVAYGALGGAVVFGLKYRSLLPERYRQVLGGAVVPTVLVFLFLGFTSNGVDNWGHLGGLLGGAATTALLKPRLLSDPPRRRAIVLKRLLPILAIFAFLFALGPLTRWWLPLLVPREDTNLGLVVSVPAEWESAAGPLEGRSYFNGLTGYGAARLSIGGSLSDVAIEPASALDELLKKELWQPETDGRLHVVQVTPAKPLATKAGLRGLERDALFRRDGTTFELRSLAVSRGQILYVVEAYFDVGQARYHQIFDRMLGGIDFSEPDFLTQARARRFFAPSSEEAKRRLTDATDLLQAVVD